MIQRKRETLSFFELSNLKEHRCPIFPCLNNGRTTGSKKEKKLLTHAQGF